MPDPAASSVKQRETSSYPLTYPSCRPLLPPPAQFLPIPRRFSKVVRAQGPTSTTPQPLRPEPPVRQLIRRFCSCERGAGLVEYGLILGILALGVIGVMHVFRRAVGDMTNRTAVTISKQSATGYAAGSALGGASSGAGSPVSPEPPAPPPDSAIRGRGASLCRWQRDLYACRLQDSTLRRIREAPFTRNGATGVGKWSGPGSNRRPPACKAWDRGSSPRHLAAVPRGRSD